MRSIAPALPRHRRRAAASRFSSRCGSTPTVATANCGRMPRGLRLETEIEFDHPLIGRQKLALDIEPNLFRRELARARTFGFMRDVTKLWSAGYALGASFENTVVIAEDRILNAEGVRFPDEFVRHKAVDAIGDLALAGAPLDRRLSVGARRPQAQSRRGHGIDGGSERLDLQRDGRTGAPPARPCRHCGRSFRRRSTARTSLDFLGFFALIPADCRPN